MEQDFLKNYFKEHYDLEVLVPDKPVRDEVNRIIFEELCRGEILEKSRDSLKDAIKELKARGAEGGYPGLH